jgi:acetyl esterase/lipase
MDRPVLFYPVTGASFDTDSYHQFAEGYFLRRGAMQWFWDQYTPDEDQRNEITASPLRATAGDLPGLPKAVVITGEADVLRDEGEAYSRRLREAGVDVTATRYEGIIHDFVMPEPGGEKIMRSGEKMMPSGAVSARGSCGL